MQFLFWVVIAVFYLALAIVTYLTGSDIIEDFRAIEKQRVTTSVAVSEKKRKMVYFEPSLLKAFKSIIYTSVTGFVLAAIAAVISAMHRSSYIRNALGRTIIVM